MLWFNFIRGSYFLFFCFWVWQCMIITWSWGWNKRKENLNQGQNWTTTYIHWLYLTNWPEKKCIFCIFTCLLSLFRWQRRSQTRFWICQKSAPNNLKRQLSWSNILFTIDFCLRKQLMFIRGTHREYSLKPLKHSIVERILVFKR